MRNAPIIYDHVRIAPEKQMGRHSHDDSWELSYVITGKGNRTVGDTEEPFSEGDMVLIPPEIPHVWNFDPEVTDRGGMIENMTIIIRKDFLEKVAEALPGFATHIMKFQQIEGAISLTGEKADEIISLLKSMRSGQKDEQEISVLKIIRRVADDEEGRIIGRYAKPDLTAQRLSKISIYTVCNFARNITLDEVASYSGMNRSAFCTFFRKHMGKTYFNYLNEMRIEEAARLLKGGRMSVSDICFACGFNDISYFSRTFRRLKGCPPSAYPAKK
ncbi:MAG: helix-turn-helix domain-containing protein [Bacteroidales bacterium]|nr:helix-turn-helix domain-containing protein [Bacteroidales bacterium]